MKRIAALFLSLLTVAFSLAPALRASASPVNLISNPGAETSTNGTAPDGWQQGGWGTNGHFFTWVSNGHTSSHSLKVQVNSYTDGDAKWYFTPVNVIAGRTYNYSEYYHANAASDVVVQLDDGVNYHYIDLGTQPVSSAWAHVGASFTVPAGYTHATVFHLLNSVGIMQTDDYSLTQDPALGVQLTAPTAGTVSGASVPLSATASSLDGVAGVQFRVDGENIGNEITSAPYQSTWDSTTVSNGSHTITAVARDNDGSLLTSNSAQVTVNNVITDSTNLVPNPGLEAASILSKNTPVGWQPSSWGTNKPLFTYTDAANSNSGNHGVKVQLTSYTDGDAKWTFRPVAVDSSKLYDFTDYFKASTESYVVADFGMADGTDQYITLGTLKSSGWAKFEEQFSVPKGAQTVTVFHLIHSVGWLETDDYSLHSYQPVGFSRPLVSLTFDDAWASVYNNGLPVLQKYGFNSTQYLLTGFTSDPDYMTVAMMQSLHSAGQEIASHTVDHPDLTTLTNAQLKQELGDSKTSLQQWTGATVTDFASPYGSVDQNAMTEIKHYYQSHRGVVAGFNSKNFFNPYDIKVQDVTSTTTVADIQGWVAQAQATNTWLVLVYHQVSTDPTAGDYNTTPAQLDAQFGAIQASGVTVETVSQALAELQPQL